MRLLLVHRYFEPDTAAYGRLLPDIADWLAADGHQVEVLTALPSYSETAKKAARRELRASDVLVRRMRLLPESRALPVRRALNAMIFVVRVAYAVGRSRHDLVMFATQPPVALGLGVRGALRVTGRRGQYVYHVQDIHPEVSMRDLSERPSRLLRLAHWVDTRNVREARQVVTLSTDMADTLCRRPGVDGTNIAVINNHATATTPSADEYQQAGELLDHLGVEDSHPLVVFAGNLGRFQRLSDVLSAFADAHVRRPDIRLVFLGEGPMAVELRQRMRNDGLGHVVHLPGQVPSGVARAVVQRADLAVLSLSGDMLSLAYPSKTMTYALAGTPVLATTTPATALGRDLQSLNAGMLADDVPSIAKAMVSVERVSPSRRDAIAAASRDLMGAERARSSWTELFRALDPTATTRDRSATGHRRSAG